MYIIPKSRLQELDIEDIFLKPYVKGPKEIKSYEFSKEYKYFLFVCNKSESELKLRFPGAYSWIEKFRNSLNKNKTKTIIQKGIEDRHKPFWYSLNPKAANIVTQINPFERHFFCFSKNRFIPDQRFGVINVKDGYDVELVAALLNSTISYLFIELKGTDRNLGALDLNANYFKSFKILNPDLLSIDSKKRILRKFQPLKKRKIFKIADELKMQDRIEFDRVILKSYHLDVLLLDNIYMILLDEIRNRVEMSAR